MNTNDSKTLTNFIILFLQNILYDHLLIKAYFYGYMHSIVNVMMSASHKLCMYGFSDVVNILGSSPGTALHSQFGDLGWDMIPVKNLSR